MNEENTFPSYQWSMFLNDKKEQLVVRHNDFETFILMVEKAKSQFNGQEKAVVHTETREHFCNIHNKEMKQRVAKDGHTYYDHRWQVDEVWKKCFGKGEVE